jgi:hypothetical protein
MTSNPPRLAAALAALALAYMAGPAQARQVLFVSNAGNNTVGAYNAVTGATINPAFIGTSQGLNVPWGLALDGNNHLFVANDPAGTNGWAGLYNATTGATINANFLTVPAGYVGLNFSWLALDANNHAFVLAGAGVREYDATTGAPINMGFISPPVGAALALDGQNHIFVGGGTTVAEYDATTGATMNASFITLTGPGAVSGLTVDALGHLLLAKTNGSVGEYDVVTGATINANFVTGLHIPRGLALDGNNHLFVANSDSTVNSVGEYDATTGATINANFITGLSGPVGLAFMPVPEPSSLLLVAAAAAIGVGRRQRRRSGGRGSASDVR